MGHALPCCTHRIVQFFSPELRALFGRVECGDFVDCSACSAAKKGVSMCACLCEYTYMYVCASMFSVHKSACVLKFYAFILVFLVKIEL